jgi:hypothetical protein
MSKWLDYVIASAIFLGGMMIIFGLVNNYIDVSSKNMEIRTLRAESEYIFSMMNNRMNISSGPYNMSDLGLMGNVYMFEIIVNNTRQFYKNPGQSTTDLLNELVYFNIESLGVLDFDRNSVAVNDESQNHMNCEKSGSTYVFSADVKANSEKKYFVYLDIDSNFTARQETVTGSDNLTEEKFFIRPVGVLQYRSMQYISSLNYSGIRNGVNFNISVVYANGTTFWSYGEGIVRNRDIVSNQNPVMFQDSSGRVNNGRLVVNVW